MFGWKKSERVWRNPETQNIHLTAATDILKGAAPLSEHFHVIRFGFTIT